MPIYTQVQDLLDRFGTDELIALTDRADPPAGAVDVAVAERALADADAEINGYLARRYELPLTAVPALLVRVGADIARFRLWDDRASDEVRRRYEDAMRLLRDVADGRVQLEATATPAPSAFAAFEAPPRVFPPRHFGTEH